MKTKYDIGQEVFVLREAKPTRVKVWCIEINCDAETNYTLQGPNGGLVFRMRDSDIFPSREELKQAILGMFEEEETK